MSKKMYILPSKFTGINAEPISFAKFKALCYSLQLLGLIHVHKVDGYNYPNNYYMAEVSDKAGKFYFYQNCFAPVGGFGVITEHTEEYFDKKELVNAIATAGNELIILSASELDEQVTNAHLSELNQEELKVVKQWLPSSVGKLLFSWYFD
ncbi:hypothetical protein H0A36_08555 [Endozoicomonas sp. SM1973]|uniref:Uncharacterized protein n=1 Tax=Spartinivicinus marinus TaxID=2994442 RepID=A0A853I3K3_9GAMM|nr:hypothetical protein [Spartinivicinus marinus]MCX4027217.1 hypothetical protein [Spartinivicinus marinus]NYZ66062.1 hypothetical protein [Spartinivicinus marinus]